MTQGGPHDQKQEGRKNGCFQSGAFWRIPSIYITSDHYKMPDVNMSNSPKRLTLKTPFFMALFSFLLLLLLLLYWHSLESI